MEERWLAPPFLSGCMGRSVQDPELRDKRRRRETVKDRQDFHFKLFTIQLLGSGGCRSSERIFEYLREMEVATRCA